MPVDSFRFVSPGVFINEIDQSQVPRQSAGPSGPVIFGVAEKGPALVPTKVSSFSEFVNIFGAPIPGSDGVSDVWRDGNYSNPTYGAYAAQAYLANGGPITFVRLVGDEDPAGSDKNGWVVNQIGARSEEATYGLFIMGTGSNNAEGVLAAVIHTKNSASVFLKGQVGIQSEIGEVQAQAAIQRPVSVGSTYEYKILVSSSTTGRTEETTFNFKPTSARYIRKVLNTNPHLLNSSITPTVNLKDYFLAESFDRAVVDNISNFDDDDVTRTELSGTYAVVLGLSTGSAYGGYHSGKYETPASPWIVGQDLSDDVTNFDVNASTQRLFRVYSREGVEYAQSHYKISISDIKQSPNPQYESYGTFTLLVRDIRDTDENPVVFEQYNNLNLNPASSNFIGRRIGDKSYEYDSTNQKWREVGQYPVISQLIRVELDETVTNGDHEASLLPFGFRGLPIYTPFNLQSASAEVLSYDINGSGSAADNSIVSSGTSGSVQDTNWTAASASWAADVLTLTPAVLFGGLGQSTNANLADIEVVTASIVFPDLPMRISSSDGRLRKNTNAFFGLNTNQAASTLVFDGTIRDLVRTKPMNIAGDNVILSPGFSLDDLVYDGGTAGHSGSDIFVYCDTITGTGNPLGAQLGGDPGGDNVRRGTPTGGRRANTSMTAVSSSYQEVLDRGFNRFTVPLYGGFDGFDIFEKNPFNNTRQLTGTSKTGANNSAYYTLKKAIDSVADVDQVDINMATLPGITDTQTTDYLIAMAEERKDTMAIIDLEGGYTSSTENTDSFSSRNGNSATVVQNVENREFNSSYAAAYYPWVQINDTLSSRRVWVPPSTVALGVLAASAAKSELWFAPAGFNRGGLNNGNAGLNVVNVVDKLTADQRDSLYEVNVNPIASFPAEGLVVFGQKTLQATPSALDRINVRRLMIFLKKEIRKIANGILFDPNQRVTWDRFLNQVNPFLASIQNRFGLSDYRVVLDSSTTTPDLVDRNIMYAKILLKPTRAIEFIALDFVITNSGVEF